MSSSQISLFTTDELDRLNNFYEELTLEKEAIKLANDTEFGLGSAIWSKDGARTQRVAGQIQAGIVMVNCPFSAMPGTPFGGYKQSGFGRELCIETLDLYTETKSIVSYYGSRPLNPLGL